MTIVSDILDNLRLETFDNDGVVPEHCPEMLLIGCVDARKDPTSDLGIARGRALILRNIAALIRGASVAPEQRETEAAALEFAVKVMKVKHIVVMGHTDCGGIRASLLDVELSSIKTYLSPLTDLKKQGTVIGSFARRKGPSAGKRSGKDEC
jgi:carbonic anhydrase